VEIAGYDRFQRAGMLPAHVHSRAFEICVILSGSVDWWAGDELWEVSGGEIYVTRPGEPHGGVDATMNPCELYWFHVAIPSGRPMPGLGARESTTLRTGLMNLTRRSFRASPNTLAAAERLHAEHAQADAYSVVAARAALHALLAGVLRDHAGAVERDRVMSDPVRRAQAYMLEHLTDPFRIEDAAAASGISVGRLHARFAAETGQTPADWRLRHLIARAKSELRGTSRSVTQIALELGFSSSQYFATAFRRVAGITPGNYRASHGPLRGPQ
jgi:AraC-like DNA-binding protein